MALKVPQAVRESVIGVWSEPVTYTVEHGAVLRFIRALNDEGPRYYGDGEQGTASSDGLPVPPTFLCSLFAGPRKVDWENPYEGLLDAGVEWDFFENVRVGDRITVASRVTEMTDKQGRVGDMLLVTTEFRYTNQQGKLVATQRNTLAWYEPKVAKTSRLR